MQVSRVYCVFSGSRCWQFRNIQPSKLNSVINSIKESAAVLRVNFPSTSVEACRPKSSNSSLTESKESDTQHQLTIGEKVKQTTKDASYVGVIIAGVGITGLMLYAILRELLSGQSPNSVYAEALKKCKKNDQVIDAVGQPIKGYGEENSRGRRRHVSFLEYEKDGVNYMRMKFYIQGSRRKGTVHLEVKENERKKYEYRYLFVELNGYPKKTIVLEDNREVGISV